MLVEETVILCLYFVECIYIYCIYKQVSSSTMCIFNFRQNHFVKKIYSGTKCIVFENRITHNEITGSYVTSEMAFIINNLINTFLPKF